MAGKLRGVRLNEGQREHIRTRSRILVERHKTGDKAAFPELYKLHMRVVRGYARKVAGLYRAPAKPVDEARLIEKNKTKSLNDDEARLDAICTNVWTVVLAKIEEFDLARDFRKWILGITRYEARLDIRHQRKRPQALEHEPLDHREMLPDERAQLRMDLARAFGCLDGPEKQAVLLKFYEGLDQDEIAKALGVAVGSVSGILKRALAKLRPYMKGWSNTDRFRDGEES
jgi:RNA polymerase sigma factor (sigma-70 family)